MLFVFFLFFVFFGNGETRFLISGLVAELHVFEYGGTTFEALLGKLALNAEDFYVKTIGWG